MIKGLKVVMIVIGVILILLGLTSIFMPEQMGEEEIEKIVDEVMGHPSLKLRNGADFGKVMGMVMGKTRGQADGKMVANVVKKKLDRG